MQSREQTISNQGCAHEVGVWEQQGGAEGLQLQVLCGERVRGGLAEGAAAEGVSLQVLGSCVQAAREGEGHTQMGSRCWHGQEAFRVCRTCGDFSFWVKGPTEEKSDSHNFKN